MHTKDDQKAIVDKLMAEDILFHWSMLSVDLDENDSQEVLDDILTLWLNIRGFSVTGLWVEHKKMCGAKTKSNPGLHKGLNRPTTLKNYSL